MKRVSILLLSVCLIFGFSSIFSDGSAKTIVMYPNIDGLEEASFGYQMMALALKNSGKPYQLQLYPLAVNTERAFSLLSEGKLSAADNAADSSLEEQFNMVPIPLDGGLLGWRLFIIHQNQVEDFAKIKTLQQLHSKTAGQGRAWPDVVILKSAGLQVITSSKIENLLKMLDRERFDFFPLGAGEIYGFLRFYKAKLPNLVIENSLVLVYPSGHFFYVNKENTELYADIIKGLENAYSQGSYQRLMSNHPFMKEGLGKAQLATRTAIHIKNPLNSEKFNAIDAKWFYRLE
ncbi:MULTISPECIES: hypothetical protein [unclassified Agarivorans]|uniref:hypothetical protein n=1 Tax=unclassified Agarivorans TaxID=2636026 RepID=UPI003D7E26E7